MVKCVLSLCHSNADVERSFSANKIMMSKQNMVLNEETIIGLRASNTAVEECGDVNEVPITQDLLIVCYKFSQAVHRASERGKCKEKTERCWNVKAETIQRETWWNKNWREMPAWKARIIKYWTNSSTEGYGESYELCWRRGQKIDNGFKANDMMKVQAGDKLIEFRGQQQCEANTRLSEISGETKLRVSYLKSAKLNNLNLKLEYSSETKISITWVYGILLVCRTSLELLCLVIQNINLVT